MPPHPPNPWPDQHPLALDALLADAHDDRWNRFYADRARPVPFFGPAPDESLARWIEDGVMPPGRALDLGCGNGRNAVLLARSGFRVDAVDYSQAAIEWATQRAADAGVRVRFHKTSVFDAPIAPASFDLVYDSGCFHHMPPHRRADYIALVGAALKRGGLFGLNCFRPEGGSGLTDHEVYERRTLGGGLGYAEDRLRALWSGEFEILELRQMQDHASGSAVFGPSFLWVMRARRR